MAIQVLKNCRIYHGGYDLSGKHNDIKIDYGAEAKDRTAFLSGARQRVSGLTDAEITGSGWWDVDDSDPAFFNGVGVDGGVITVCPTTGALGELAYFMRGVDGRYEPGGQVGELVAFNFAAYGDGALVRGVVMETGSKAVDGNGTPRQFAAVTAGQKMCLAFHLTGLAGTTPEIEVTVYSNSGNTWDGSETLRHTFTLTDAVGAQLIEIDGPITDTWWRASWDVSGSGDDLGITIALSMGIK